MDTVCKNCAHKYRGKFCSECGQSAAIERLTLKSAWTDIKSVFLHYNKSIFYTTKQMFLRPGLMARDYIEGKRIPYYHPFSYLLFVAGILVFLYHSFDIRFVLDSGSKVGEALNTWTKSHYVSTMLLTVPVMATCTYIAFRREGYNYIEHLFMNTFFACQRMLLQILAFPILVIANTSHHLSTAQSIITFFQFVLTAFVLHRVFNHIPPIRIVGKIMLTYLLLMVLALVVSIILLSIF